MESSADIAKKLADYDASRKSSADIINEAMAKYGAPEIRTNVANLRTTIANTENALNNVDPSVTGRTSRSLVTEAQRQAMVNQERAPISQQLNDQSRALGVESSNLSDAERLANIYAQGSIDDYATGRSALQQRYTDAVNRETADLAKQQADREYALKVQQAQASQKAQAASAAPKAHAQQRAGGGFNFQDSSGNAISARTYAALMGISFNSLLNQMASAGDSGAADYLKNGSKSKAAKALTWG